MEIIKKGKNTAIVLSDNKEFASIDIVLSEEAKKKIESLGIETLEYYFRYPVLSEDSLDTGIQRAEEEIEKIEASFIEEVSESKGPAISGENMYEKISKNLSKKNTK